MEELVYLYFRFTSFKSMGDGYFENVEAKDYGHKNAKMGV